MAVDHKGSLTADPGAQILVSQFSNWKNAENFNLPSDTLYVTIKVGRKNNAIGGILAAFSNGFVTDSSWQCTEISSTTKNPWPAAHVVATNDGSHSRWNRIVANISPEAKWIWTSNSGDSEVWCRKSFGGLKFVFLQKNISVRIIFYHFNFTIIVHFIHCDFQQILK